MQKYLFCALKMLVNFWFIWQITIESWEILRRAQRTEIAVY